MPQPQLAPTTPSWFTTALSNKPEHSTVDVDGCRIHVRRWGHREKPPLVLVHGGAAHSGWWDHIAPFFCLTHQVIVPDLSGHGDSDARTTYSLDTWAREIITAVTAFNSAERPVIVGHSMGGWITAMAAQRYGERIDGIVIIDSPLHDHAPERMRLNNLKLKATGYRTKDEIVGRFNPVPSQQTVLPYVRRHIAAESVREAPRGWVWKFDPIIFDAPLLDEMPSEQETMERALGEMPCRIAYMRCEAGLVDPDMGEVIRSLLQLRGPFIELAEAGHHPMLDQPLPLVATLRTLLEMWSIT